MWKCPSDWLRLNCTHLLLSCKKSHLSLHYSSSINVLNRCWIFDINQVVEFARMNLCFRRYVSLTIFKAFEWILAQRKMGSLFWAILNSVHFSELLFLTNGFYTCWSCPGFNLILYLSCYEWIFSLAFLWSMKIGTALQKKFILQGYIEHGFQLRTLCAHSRTEEGWR